MPLFSQAEISEYSFSAVLERGRQLHTGGCVGNLLFIGTDILATVTIETVFRVVISRNGNQLNFKCNCTSEHAGACEHAVAAMYAANDEKAIQVGINWDELTPLSSQQSIRQNTHKGNGPEEPSQNAVIVHQQQTDRHEVNIIEIPPQKPVMRLYLSEQEGMLLVEIRFAYYNGTVEFTRGDPVMQRLIPDAGGEVVRVNRSRARETSLSSTLASFELTNYRTGFYTPVTDPRVWTLQQLPLLAAEGHEIYGQENLHATQARKTNPKLTVTVNSDDTSINCKIDMDFEGISATLSALIAAVRQRSRFILLSDGSTGMLPQKWLDTFSSLFFDLEGELQTDTIKINRSHIGVADLLGDIADAYSGDTRFEQQRRLLVSFDGVTRQVVPADFKAELREYQQAGFDWFYFLKEFRFGGCLADDMGLGKTVQTLALLLKEKVLGEGQPSLVVVPNSLLYNWQRESHKV